MSCVFIGPLFQAPLFPRDILVYRNSNCCQNYRSDICQQCRRDDIKIPAYFQNFIQCLLIANISMIFLKDYREIQKISLRSLLSNIYNFLYKRISA